MLALLFLVSLSLFGILLVFYSFSKLPPALFLGISFAFGSVISVWIVYLFAIVFRGGLVFGVLAFLLVDLLFVVIARNALYKSLLIFTKLKPREVLIFLFILFGSFLLFQNSFSYDPTKSKFLISSNLYQDMGAHIPFIRSFSMGNNFPAEVPFFAGEKLSYHFMFDLYIGILEFLGMRIDVAFNLISSVAFTFLLFTIFHISLALFNSRLVGVVAPALFFFNSDLSFITFFKNNGFSLSSIWHNSFYLTDNLFSVPFLPFLHLNVILNQRHLVFTLLVLFLIVFLLIDKRLKSARSNVILIFMIGLLPFWNSVIFFAIILLMASFIMLNIERGRLLPITIFSLLVAVPQLIFIKISTQSQILFNPGFLVYQDFSFAKLSSFWIWSLGFSIPLIFLGVYLSNNLQRKIFLSFLPLFILPNLFQFAPNMFDNHKFFNIWIIVANIFVAFGLVSIFKSVKFWRFPPAITFLLKPLSVCFFVAITLSGFLNFLVAKNDVKVRIGDHKKNALINWAKDNISKNSIYITNGDIYDPLSIMGNRVFLTRPHYIFLYGGNPKKRIEERGAVLRGESSKDIESLLQSKDIGYIVIYKENLLINSLKVNRLGLEKKYNKIYEDQYGIIFKI